jgi:hypothetical protein
MSDIIYTPPASSGGGTTINPTNNYIPVRSNATTFIDSLLFSNTNNLKSVYGGNDVGLKLEFANKYYQLGDFGGLFNYNYISVDDLNNNIKIASQGYINVGDADFNGNKYVLTIQNSNSGSYTFLGNLNGDTSGFNYSYLGNGTTNYYSLTLGCAADGFGLANQETNDPNTSFGSFITGGTMIIQSSSNKPVNINAYGSNTNILILDPASNKMSFTTGALNFVGASLQSNTSGGNSGRHLVITLNGTQYKIQLLNP